MSLHLIHIRRKQKHILSSLRDAFKTEQEEEE